MFLKSLVFVILVHVDAAHCDDLVATVMIFRHGDRVPRLFHPNDPYRNNSYWPVPFGELIEKGKTRAYELGKWARQRYENFLPAKYSSEDFFIYSTGIDRTLMSGALFAAGLYPSSPSSRHPPFQAIPIHSKPPTQENTIMSENKPCPKYIHLKNKLLNTTYFRKFDERNKKLYEYMSKHMGTTITSFVELSSIYDTFFIEESFNFTLPEWVKNIYPEKLKDSVALNILLPTYNVEMAKFKIGCMYSEILNYFKSFTNDPNGFESDFDRKGRGKKMLAVSGHDITLERILNTLKVPLYLPPPYSSSIIFELKRRTNSKLYVNVIFKNNTEIQKLKIPGCGFNCALESFIDYLKPIVMSPRKWNEKCEII